MQTFPKVQVQAWREGTLALRDILGFSAATVAGLAMQAQAHIAAERYKEALQLVVFIEQLEPGNLRARLVAAQVLMAMGRAAEAEARVRAVLADHPRNAESWLLMAELAFAGGAVTSAVDALERATTTLDPGPAGRAAGIARRILSNMDVR